MTREDRAGRGRVEVAYDCFRFKHVAGTVARAVRAALFFGKKEKTAVFVFLVSDSVMAKINRETRGKNRATNVLSFVPPGGFPHPEAGDKNPYLGEIYLAPDFIKKSREDIAFLAIHAALHLLGYSHAQNNDRIEMEACEKKIYSAYVKHHHRN
ncbi:rRNA maturation RNase YbeY [Candidatus Jorgensenbacteria bacterium RIFCSPLOWO2_02_FULL_45_12]|uniref:Endoribonuclease YbeY n=2 Tax=Candidatus Joergenseniibacteriota TaxID=1752739 RepID=A0A1F6BNU4_9BACT|nr:MAG: putative rRNA maturation factor [Candidatus Jorgensenbacteria bacterium GW2011_GWA2_45_9]OGG38227.1 MAG: rRNA maturation RNase YbeY [Candidatus Jorgensenbacteria bacterium RIFCSPHIGHO2_02_FULL_45_20]OGG42605.1 MAG: rRNA maturation RNase YbeY [Candidatus Jorgensenbacteria bacterium RIFCSPLOWO2_02_FULL_45_12]